ncbi:hypothetical protein DH2020_016077 [Rehmannia glutinosa]|uniref:Pentatricopeptide repeat-containing protein n=1 Tax=Rehmannia glutinosa TaxID=99300 RepID=A0ABR0WV99_REHGL
MGLWEAFLNWLRSLFFKQEMELSLIGLQNAGKTSLVNVVATGGYSEDMIPTVGFNMRKVTKGNVTIKLWDLGGQPRFRSMWERYCRAVSAIVYVVDAADHDNISISKSELHDLLSKPSLSGIPLLVLGNKIDKPQALSKQALTDQMWHPKDQLGPGRTCLNPGYDPDSQPHVEEMNISAIMHFKNHNPYISLLSKVKRNRKPLCKILLSIPLSVTTSMEASTRPLNLPNLPPQPNLENIKQKLLKHGVQPTPRILHNIRKKELQKSNRRLAKQTSKLPPPLTDTQQQAILEESHFQTIKSEYKKFTKSTRNEENEKLVGKPWERLERLKLRELASGNTEYDGERLDPEHLRELSDIIECERDKFTWLLDNDIELEEGLIENDGKRWAPPKRSETEAIKIFINRLSATEVSVKDWKFVRMMRYSGLQFTEGQMLKIVEGLGDKGHWRHALSVVEWVYNSKEHKYFKSRFVYTKLLKVLGRARKPREALKGDAHIYPDMAAYHCLAVTLGQAGFIKELLNVLNACVQTCQWKGVSWVFQQMRKNGLRPNGASYGLAMEVMLKSGKYDLVHEFFARMKRNGEALKALTYKVLARAFWEEGKVNDAVQTVRDMERRGVIGTASVYYELARCLCFHGRWEDAILEIEKLKKLRPTRSLVVTFTGMIKSSMDGGHVQDCILLFEHIKTLMAPDIGLINSMLKVYGRNDMFLQAKELFEETMRYHLHSEIGEHGDGSFPKADVYTFSSMLEASASALQWEYFEYIYKEMTLSGYQVDQRKHSALLVEASRAGKWHLLEHAFDSILEAGEIPPVSFFTEMACQAIIQHDYERAVNIVNTMAHAPFQEKLVIRDLVNEATVINFSKALHFMCESCEDSLNSIFDKNPKDSIPTNTIGSNLDWNLDIREGNLVNSGGDKDLEVSGLSNNRREGNFEHIEDEEGHFRTMMMISTLNLLFRAVKSMIYMNLIHLRPMKYSKLGRKSEGMPRLLHSVLINLRPI